MSIKPLTLQTTVISTLIFTIINIVNITSSTPTSASVVANGREYWSFDEVLELRDDAATELASLCHGDLNCEDEIIWSNIETDPKYMAFEAFDHPGFFMPSINPANETLTLFYNDVPDRWMQQFGFEEAPAEVGNLYLFWLDEDMENPFNTMYVIENYINLVKNGIPLDGLHPVLVRDNAYDGTEWFSTNQKVEFLVTGTDLIFNTRGFIYNWLGSTDPNNQLTIGSFGYKNCIDSPDYEPGMECKLMFSTNGSRIYLPFAQEESDGEPDITEEPNPEDLNTDVLTEDPVNEQPDDNLTTTDPAVPILDSATEAESEISDGELSNENLPNNPDTGVVATVAGSDRCTKVVDFPDWLIGLLIAGDAVLLWWFSPRRHKNKNR